MIVDKLWNRFPKACGLWWRVWEAKPPRIVRQALRRENSQPWSLADIPKTEAVFASITHLRFDPRLSVSREIIAYQKHRVKRLRRHAS